MGGTTSKDKANVQKSFFEEIAVKIQRSHMQQAYLFDHIQPGMPAFNTNLFKLAQPTYLEAHAFQATEAAEKLSYDLSNKFDAAEKAYAKLKKGQATPANYSQLNKTLQNIQKDDSSHQRLNFLMLS